jgi:hypothetical protein
VETVAGRLEAIAAMETTGLGKAELHGQSSPPWEGEGGEDDEPTWLRGRRMKRTGVVICPFGKMVDLVFLSFFPEQIQKRHSIRREPP